MQLTIDGTHFDVTDEGTGDAIVLLHGFPLSKESWEAQAAALAVRARVIRIDLRGLGASEVTPGPYLMEALASDVAAILDALAVERAVVAGHSLGGYIAFAFVRLFTERCRGLGIVCSRATPDTPAQAAAREALAARSVTEGMAPIAESFVARYFAASVYTEHPELVARAQELCLRTDPRGAAAMLRGMAERVSSEDLFDEIAVPVRVIAGESDAFVDVATMRALADGIPGAKLDVLPCGHMPLWELPEATTASLAALLDDVTARDVATGASGAAGATGSTARA